jgi:hypothetical protein
MRAGQLAAPVLSLAEGLKQDPSIDESVPPLGQTAGVEPGGDEYCRGSDERARNHIFCMIPNSFVPLQNLAPYKREETCKTAPQKITADMTPTENPEVP